MNDFSLEIHITEATMSDHEDNNEDHEQDVMMENHDDFKQDVVIEIHMI